jgi:hypothetical protein
LFLSKTLGRSRFHSEFNAETAPEYDSDGIHLFPRRPSLNVKLDSPFVNYNQRDWLQLPAGLLFIPIYSASPQKSPHSGLEWRFQGNLRAASV